MSGIYGDTQEDKIRSREVDDFCDERWGHPDVCLMCNHSYDINEEGFCDDCLEELKDGATTTSHKNEDTGV